LDLTPEERQRIYEEEKIRVEARTQIEQTQKEQLLQARRVSPGKPSIKRIILFSCLALALLTFVAWKIRLTLANNEIVAMVQLAGAHVGDTPSDDDWKYIYAKAAVTRARDADHRAAALLFMRSLQYATTNERVAASYRSLGLELEELNLLDTAEYCHRVAVGLAPGNNFGRTCLADLLVKQKKYAEAEPIYLELLQGATDPNDRFSLNVSLARLLEATGRKAEADQYEKENEKLVKQLK
jgi:tetratricopeptide (TPR) repeat protein